MRFFGKNCTNNNNRTKRRAFVLHTVCFCKQAILQPFLNLNVLTINEFRKLLPFDTCKAQRNRRQSSNNNNRWRNCCKQCRLQWYFTHIQSFRPFILYEANFGVQSAFCVFEALDKYLSSTLPPFPFNYVYQFHQPPNFSISAVYIFNIVVSFARYLQYHRAFHQFRRLFL